MGMTILEKLSEQGIRSRNVSLGIIRELVVKHQVEIEEARSRGYSWGQIDKVCRELWQDEGAKNVHWWKNGDLVEQVYRSIKNGTALNSSKKVEPLRFSVEVKKH